MHRRVLTLPLNFVPHHHGVHWLPGFGSFSCGPVKHARTGRQKRRASPDGLVDSQMPRFWRVEERLEGNRPDETFLWRFRFSK